jgi:hypothetical protein
MKFNPKSKNDVLLKVKKDPWFLREALIQNTAICLAAVSANGHTLKHVKNQTEAICLAAVKNSGMALVFAKNQTPEICLAAIKSAPEAFAYVKNQTEEICTEAIKKEGWLFNLVKDQTVELCILALELWDSHPIYTWVKIVPNPSHHETLKNLYAKKDIIEKMKYSFSAKINTPEI